MTAIDETTINRLSATAAAFPRHEQTFPTLTAHEIERMRRLMEDTLAHHTGRTSEQVRIDTDRDKILTASEAVDYGIIDQVFDYRKLNA